MKPIFKTIISTILGSILISSSGCKSCKPEPFREPSVIDTSLPWKVSSLIYANPSAITLEQLETREQELYNSYRLYNQSYGIIYPGLYTSIENNYPTKFAGGGDSALFTGFALSAFCYRGRVLGDYSAAKNALRGIYWLTHAAGRGVICRAVIPLDRADKWNYPAAWQSRINSGFANEGEPITTPWGDILPKSAYYTRATRDQLTGLLYGLAVAWAYLEDQKDLIRFIVRDLYLHLKKHNWRIRDQFGKNDTSADKVSGLLKLQFYALYRLVAKEYYPEDYEEANSYYLNNFHVRSITDIANIFNNYSQYYAHNLRVARALTIWTLETNTRRRESAASYILNNVWKYTKHHKNAWFAAAAYVVSKNSRALEVYDYSIKSQSLKPLRGFGSPYAGQKREPSLYNILDGCADNFVIDPHLRKMTNYFIWTKRPWDTGHRDFNGYLNETGLDFLLPYWLVESHR